MPDPALEAIVRERTHTPYGAMKPADLQAVLVIDASRGLAFRRPCIYSVRGLEYAVNLVKVDLGWNAITDISPLAGLTKLNTLNLENNRITDISPLASVTSLTQLVLSGNQIQDISALSSLANLRTLNLSGNALDPSESSDAMQVITQLKARGVVVQY